MASGWQHRKSKFRVLEGNWTAELEPSRPDRGLTIACGPSRQNQEFQAFAVVPLPSHALQAEEIYVRDDDLIARFRQSASDAYAFQLNWRLLKPVEPFSFAVELWVSIQTQLFDSAPEIEVSFRSAASWHQWTHDNLCYHADDQYQERPERGFESAQADVPAAMVTKAADSTLFWLIDPRDQGSIGWSGNLSAQRQTARLFGDFLERGVIRRARFQLWIGPSSSDFEIAKVAYRELLSSQLPLTA